MSKIINPITNRELGVVDENGTFHPFKVIEDENSEIAVLKEKVEKLEKLLTTVIGGEI